MKVHHLNCGTCCPLGGRLFDGVSKGAQAHLVCHCLLIETEAHGLVLVDTGFGTRDVSDPTRLPAFFRNLLNVQFRETDTALAQVRALGHQPQDVRHIIVSHLDLDHAGGLEDFPDATIHVMRRELEAARAHDGGVTGKLRFQPKQWDAVTNWRLHNPGEGERWFGFEAVRDLPGLPPEILMIPLTGHTHGHAGVAIRQASDWLLYAGDAYFYRGEVLDPPRRLSGATSLQRMMDSDRDARTLNQRRLRELQRDHGGEVRLFCAHDAVEFGLLAAAGG